MQPMFWGSLFIGILTGITSAVFLVSLDAVTSFRETHPWIICGLPFVGLLICWTYKRHGQGTEAGSHLLIEQLHEPKKFLPFRMAPFVLLGTLLTHLFGGSAGREGTAVQVGGTIADQLNFKFKLNADQRRTILMMGMAAGFASVFGTPLAGSFFGIEILGLRKFRVSSMLFCMTSAFIAHFVCLLCGVHHTTYPALMTPPFAWLNLLWAVAAGIAFGLCARFFARSLHSMGATLKVMPLYFRPLAGGTVVLILVWLFGTRYVGLGIPVIQECFQSLTITGDFVLKIIFTVVTLSSGFKGGEVTPLFFIGATLGNTLSRWLSLPMPLLSGMGFVAVFAGAAKTPLTATLMAVEIFGPSSILYIGTACWMSSLCSGHLGIYPRRRRASENF